MLGPRPSFLSELIKLRELWNLPDWGWSLAPTQSCQMLIFSGQLFLELNQMSLFLE